MLTFEVYAAMLQPLLLAMQRERGEAPFMLARRLNRRGMPTLNAKRWTAAQVLAVLRQPAAISRRTEGASDRAVDIWGLSKGLEAG